MISQFNHEEDIECIDLLNSYDNTDNQDTGCNELDSHITREEIRKACLKLNRNKACSIDTIIYEMFKEGIDILEKPLELLFNYILDKQTYPKSWSRGVIIPIFKKGDNSDPNNYRGITLTSCFGKLSLMSDSHSGQFKMM